MLDNIKKQIKEFMKANPEPAIDFIPNLMKRVHADSDGSLAARMNRQFIPLAELQLPKKPKRAYVWAGNKMLKRIIKGQCAGRRVEGVAAGAIRLGKQERMLNKLNPDVQLTGL